jgi:adapter protein MecA 1/2
MEYILINESKLKIILGGEELEERSLDSEELDYANPLAKKLFGDILDEARRELGFDTTGYRVLLQLYPIHDGGCELYVTRLGKLDDISLSEGENENSLHAQKKEGEKAQKNQKKRKVYRFEKLSHLCSVCKRLCDSSIKFESSAYSSENGEWYLLLCYEEPDDFSELLPLYELSFISEYGYAEDARALSLYLGEYAKEICKREAVETLGSI